MKNKWERLGWNQRNMVFGCLLFAFSWFAWTYSIRNTVELSGECTQLENRIDSAEILTASIAALQLQLDSLNRMSSEVVYVTHEQLLGIVAEYCKKSDLKLREFPEVIRIDKHDRILEIHRVTVEGPFTEIVLLAEQLRGNSLGRIVSLNFTAKTDNKSKVRSLNATFYIQCVRNQST